MIGYPITFKYKYGYTITMTGYYLDRASTNKQMIESNDFTPAQLNVMLTMMRQCWKLRTGTIINNLFEASMPDDCEIQSNLKQGQDGKEYNTYTVTKKEAEN